MRDEIIPSGHVDEEPNMLSRALLLLAHGPSAVNTRGVKRHVTSAAFPNLGMKPKFAAGRNIAIKVPPHAYEATVRFYRDVLGLQLLENHLPHVGFEFGGKQLWIDKAAGLSQAEVWLEILTDDVAAVSAHFEQAGVLRCDMIEPLPESHEGFWIMDPASIVLHLGSRNGEW